jgi:hypothetical protein
LLLLSIEQKSISYALSSPEYFGITPSSHCASVNPASSSRLMPSTFRAISQAIFSISAHGLFYGGAIDGRFIRRSRYRRFLFI